MAILAAGMFFHTLSLDAQVTSMANVEAAIVSADISSLSLASADGTRFQLQNWTETCFDVTVAGMPSTLNGEYGKEKVSYSLDFDEARLISAGITKIHVDVRFSRTVKDGTYSASEPYLLWVNYN